LDASAFAAIQAFVLIPHRWPGAPLPAVLLERENRFLARCRLADGQIVRAHVPDRGRCLDLLLPGQPVIVVAATGKLRTTAFTLLLARAKSAKGTWVSIDPAGAPRLVEAAVSAGMLFAGHVVVSREIAHGDSRIDLLLSGDVLCEVKSVGAASGGIALFPDAPTERGARHLRRLAARARKGLPAAVVFCAQRGDVDAIAPDTVTDPAFARALSRASRAGVSIKGLACSAHPRGMRLRGEIPVLL
jgi:sugar fermentation stimulation protein A